MAEVRRGDARDQLAELEAARADVLTPGLRLRKRNTPSGRPRHCTGNTAMPRTRRDDSRSAIGAVSGCVEHVVDQHRRARAHRLDDLGVLRDRRA